VESGLWSSQPSGASGPARGERRGADRIGRRRARLAQWCRRKPRDWEDVGNHGTPQIARAMERGVHNESSVAAMLHVRYVKSSSCFRSPAGPQTRSLTGAGCSVLIALWINSSIPPSGLVTLASPSAGPVETPRVPESALGALLLERPRTPLPKTIPKTVLECAHLEHGHQQLNPHFLSARARPS
jgi:hypothetical protein